MAESIYCSYKTLLIVSKSYLESSFCVQELNIAMDCETTTQKVLKDRVILIKLDDVSLKCLPKALRQKSYLDFSNEEQRKHYKTKLLKALPPRRETEAEEGLNEEESGDKQSEDEPSEDELSEDVMENVPLNEILNDGECLGLKHNQGTSKTHQNAQVATSLLTSC